MGSLTSFIITEGLKTRSVLALHRFDVMFKQQVTKDLQELLFATWKAAARSTKLHVDAELAQDATFKNPKALTKVLVDDKPTKLLSSEEAGKVKLVAPTVKLPLLLGEVNLALARTAFFDAAVEVFEKLISTWSEAFVHEVNGQAASDFKIKRDHRSIRFCLSHTEKNVEHEIVLYHVTVEHGKQGSKVRDHDTIYLSIDRK